VGLAELYAFMDTAIDQQSAPDQFVTAQMMRLNVGTGQLQWVNAAHPEALLIRGSKVIRRLESEGTLPVGFGGVTEDVQEMVRVLSHTLMRERGGTTSDDATLFLVEWRGGTADHLATVAI